MPRPFVLAVSLTLAIVANPVFADIVHLKNGRQLECVSARQEGDVVHYVLPAGTMSIRASLVQKIERKAFVLPPETNAIKPREDQGKIAFQLSPALIPGAAKTAQNAPNPSVDLAREYTAAGIELAQQGDLQKALEKFQKAHELQQNPITKLNLGLTYFAMREDSSAKVYLKQVLEINSRNVLALNYLGRIAWREEDVEAAIKYWEQSVATNPDPEMKQRLERLKKERSISGNYSNAPTSHFLVRYDGGKVNGRLVTQITDFLEDGYRQLSGLYQFYPSTPFVVILYPGRQFFRATDAPGWSAGLNDGKIHVPVKGVSVLSAEMRSHLIHELSHSFVDLKTSEKCPAWLQEGLAQYSEGKRVGDRDWNTLSRLMSSGQLAAFEKLEGTFASAGAQAAVVMYLQSLAFVQYLAEKHGFYQINALLDRIGEGDAYRQAIELTYLLPLNALEQQWRQEIRAR